LISFAHFSSITFFLFKYCLESSNTSHLELTIFLIGIIAFLVQLLGKTVYAQANSKAVTGIVHKTIGAE
jgi:hypothetical protein